MLISTCLWLVLISRIYIVFWGTLGSSTLSTSVWYIVSIYHPLLRINDKSNSNRGLFYLRNWNHCFNIIHVLITEQTEYDTIRNFCQTFLVKYKSLWLQLDEKRTIQIGYDIHKKCILLQKSLNLLSLIVFLSPHTYVIYCKSWDRTVSDFQWIETTFFP